MLILKRYSGSGTVFNTENANEQTPSNLNSKNLQPLHHVKEQSDYDFLTQHFGKNHPIMANFGNSYYYCVKP